MRRGHRSVNRFPYRVEPALHLYAGLLILQLSSLSLPPPSSRSSGIVRSPPGAPYLPPFERPRDDAILAAATHHLQGAVNAGAAQAGMQRASAAVMRRREERKAAKRKRKRAEEATDEEDEDAPPLPPDDPSEEEEADEETLQGEWAAELARSYLNIVRLPWRSPHARLSAHHADLTCCCSSMCPRKWALRRAPGWNGCASRKPSLYDIAPLSRTSILAHRATHVTAIAIHLIRTARRTAVEEASND